MRVIPLSDDKGGNMPEEKDDVQADSSPALEQALESASPAQQEQQTPDTETAHPQEAEVKEQEEQPVADSEQAPLHEHPRFKEVIDEKNYFKNLWEQKRQRQLSQQQFH